MVQLDCNDNLKQTLNKHKCHILILFSPLEVWLAFVETTSSCCTVFNGTWVEKHGNQHALIWIFSCQYLLKCARHLDGHTATDTSDASCSSLCTHSLLAPNHASYGSLRILKPFSLVSDFNFFHSLSLSFLTAYVSLKKLKYHQEHVTHISHLVLAWFQTSFAAHISSRPWWEDFKMGTPSVGGFASVVQIKKSFRLKQHSAMLTVDTSSYFGLRLLDEHPLVGVPFPEVCTLFYSITWMLLFKHSYLVTVVRW